MRQFLEYLQVFPRITLRTFPEDAAIEVRSGNRRFAYPARWARFREQAHAAWPHARDAVERVVADVDAICAQFKWFDLKRGRAYRNPLDLDLPEHSFAEYIRDVTDDPWLTEALGFQTFNLGLFAEEVPWVKHALAFRSNFDDTCRVDGGGGARVEAVVARGRELSVQYRFRTEVVAFACDGRNVRSATTLAGDTLEAPLFIAACPPKPILECIPDEAIRPMYKQRVLDLKDSRGALQVFLRLRAPLTSIGASCVLLNDADEASAEFPLPTILVTHPTSVESAERGGPRLEAMTYLYQKPFAAWRERPVLRRGADYERLKSALADRVIGMIARIAPELPALIEDCYVATPLSDEWYTRNSGGGVFGISHDLTQQGMNRPLPRLRLKNLWFTGHSITMPGICGTFINAFDTCDQIRGDNHLFAAVAT
jgi:all-trans-retinol 13,14-reductase